jgi:DNA-binding Xre family transcriptional regulator
MKFQELFNQWIQELGCSARELAEATGLSAAVISRYRSGTRAPLKGSQQLEQLLSGLNELSERHGISERRRMVLEEQLTGSLVARDGAFDRFYPRFDALLATLDVSMKELSRAVNYDISFLYRIRSGKRRPHDLTEFTDRICSYTAVNRSAPEDQERIAELTGAELSQLATEQGRRQALMDFLSRSGMLPQSSVEDFLRKMDGFDLEDYSASLHLNVENLSPIPLPNHRREVYYGTAQMRFGQLSFFRQTLHSRSREPIFMCTDMPMLEMAEDEIFVANWVLSVASNLEKGLHLNIIHELNRPLREMLLALEAWIPLYMTGRITPYYLPKRPRSCITICSSPPGPWLWPGSASPGSTTMAAMSSPRTPGS